VRDPDLAFSVEHTIDPYVIADIRFQRSVAVFEHKLLAETASRAPLHDINQVSGSGNIEAMAVLYCCCRRRLWCSRLCLH
jgi:hypothetical protein